MENWYALYAPKDTPRAVIARLGAAAISAIQLPDIAQVIEKSTALVPIGADGDAARARRTCCAFPKPAGKAPTRYAPACARRAAHASSCAIPATETQQAIAAARLA